MPARDKRRILFSLSAYFVSLPAARWLQGVIAYYEDIGSSRRIGARAASHQQSGRYR